MDGAPTRDEIRAVSRRLSAKIDDLARRVAETGELSSIDVNELEQANRALEIVERHHSRHWSRRWANSMGFAFIVLAVLILFAIRAKNVPISLEVDAASVSLTTSQDFQLLSPLADLSWVQIDGAASVSSSEGLFEQTTARIQRIVLRTTEANEVNRLSWEGALVPRDATLRIAISRGRLSLQIREGADPFDLAFSVPPEAEILTDPHRNRALARTWTPLVVRTEGAAVRIAAAGKDYSGAIRAGVPLARLEFSEEYQPIPEHIAYRSTIQRGTLRISGEKRKLKTGDRIEIGGAVILNALEVLPAGLRISVSGRLDDLRVNGRDETPSMLSLIQSSPNLALVLATIAAAFSFVRSIPTWRS